VDHETQRTALTIARSAERWPHWQPGDWPGLAVEMLVAGSGDDEIAELAGLPSTVTGWETETLVASLYEKYDVPTHGAEEAVALLAQLLATDLRMRPAAVTAPMIRLIAKLAPPSYESDLANECYGCAEYLDCDCASVDPRLESHLESLPPLELPGGILQVLARPFRSTLPTVQPPRGH
jgi:hypothetical protein